MRYGGIEAGDKPLVGRVLEDAYASSAEDLLKWLEIAGSEHVRVLRGDGGIHACLVRIPMGHFYGRRSVPAMGVAGVATALAARRLGLARGLMSELLRELHAEGVPLSTLYPATQALYRGVGYGIAGGRFQLQLPIAEMQIRHPEVRELAVRRIEPGEERVVAAMYSTCAGDMNGALDRGPYVWNRIRAPLRDVPRGFFVLRHGEPVGYAYIALVQRERPHYDVKLVDYVALDRAVLERIALLLADHSSLGHTVSFFGGADDPMLDVLREPHAVVRKEIPWMIRICDVAKALEARGYPKLPGAVSIGLEVHDEVLPGNCATFVLTVEDGRGVVRRGEHAVKIGCDIGGLARLYSGASDPFALARKDEIRGERSALELAATIFPSSAPWLRDMY